MQKNFVIVKHLEDNGKFLFYVPKKVSLVAGDQVICVTSRGKNVLGVCCCDSFLAKPEVVCPLFGTQPRVMKYVKGRVEYKEFEEDEDDEDEEEA